MLCRKVRFKWILMTQIMLCLSPPSRRPRLHVILAPFVNKINISLRFPVVFIFALHFLIKIYSRDLFIIFASRRQQSDEIFSTSFLLPRLSSSPSTPHKSQIIIYANFCRWIRKFAVCAICGSFMEAGNCERSESELEEVWHKRFYLVPFHLKWIEFRIECNCQKHLLSANETP